MDEQISKYTVYEAIKYYSNYCDHKMLIIFYEGVIFDYNHGNYRAILQHSISTHITSVTQVKSNNYNQFENRPI